MPNKVKPHPRQPEYNPPPWEFPKRAFLIVVISLLVTLPTVTITLISDKAFPHGPEALDGYVEICDESDYGGGGCIEAPNYIEDTSGLNNPPWVDFIRSTGQMVYVLAILLAIVVLYQGVDVWKWWKPRYGLIWPHRPDNWVRKFQYLRSALESEDESTTEGVYLHLQEFQEDMGKRVPTIHNGAWKYWNAAGRLLYGLRYYDDALWAFQSAESVDRPTMNYIPKGREAEYEDRWAEALKEIEDWHAANINYLQSNRER